MKKKKDLEFYSIKIFKDIQENFIMINSMDKEKFIFKVEILIKEIGNRINIMEQVFIFVKMETNMKANLKME